jgi:hypothetical protein
MKNLTQEQIDIIVEALDQYQAQMELDDFDSFKEHDERFEEVSDIMDLLLK